MTLSYVEQGQLDIALQRIKCGNQGSGMGIKNTQQD